MRNSSYFDKFSEARQCVIRDIVINIVSHDNAQFTILEMSHIRNVLIHLVYVMHEICDRFRPCIVRLLVCSVMIAHSRKELYKRHLYLCCRHKKKKKPIANEWSQKYRI